MIFSSLLIYVGVGNCYYLAWALRNVAVPLIVLEREISTFLVRSSQSDPIFN